MQNLQEQHNVLLKKLDEKDTDVHPTWFIVWTKEWNTSSWLMSSFISSIIMFEIYAVILSVYPNFMISIWLSLGIQTLMLTSIMTVLSIICLGFITGAVVYSAHLALTSMENFEKIYMPLVETWSNNAKRYGPILLNLLNDENFLKITQSLKDIPAAQPLVEFLKNDENAESVQKIIKLLKEIWSQDTIDMQVKTLVIHLLTKYVQEENAKQHIDNIWVLWQFLQKNEQLNIDTIINVLQNSSQVQALVGQINTFSNEPDIIKNALEKPELLTYIHAINSSFPNRPTCEKAHSIRQFYQDSSNPLITCSLFCNIADLPKEEQNNRMRLLDDIMSHANSKQLSQLLIEIQTMNPGFFTDAQKTSLLVNLIKDEANNELNLTLLASVITKLDEYQCLDLFTTKHLGQLELMHDLIESYSKFSPVDAEKNKVDIEKILQVQATTWSEREKKDFLKTFQVEPEQIKEASEQKKANRFLPKGSSVFKPFKSKKNKLVTPEEATVIKEEKKETTSIPSHKEQYQLFKSKKIQSVNDIENQMTLG